ncbi:exodeoxyribonuclease VII large subunit [Vagococcus martis]|uniref:Exodeoxyribonuclease 7 large subunit n=1 Tax=Vagococcus martis TaxID=1768210 RepID=A0A1V4DII6_9ENTE|nr:exodeoxyribonuclease VII large subunit [Vagococcus martis]OPF88251.1 exodeoxyribonuclease VII large subunit [Vagococcus martis]
MTTSDYLTVTALTKYLKRKFDADPYLEKVYLTGEVSNFRARANSHQYFSLKDDKAKISAVMFKGAYQKLKFTPEEGMKVLVVGRLSLYEASGNYQIYIDHMEPDGVGALYQAYEQLKASLEKEGLFKLTHKQSLVKYPQRIAVITSPSGAVIKDIMTTIQRRYPIAQLVLFPTKVQGDDAAGEIVQQIKEVDAIGNFDTMIVGRGGGSIEDLWSFNTEEVVRAVFEARTPVISSVGHETDTTLTDLVADVRAATPTAAAELAVPVLQEELLKIREKQSRLYHALDNQLKHKRARFEKASESVIFKQPNRLYEAFYLQLDNLDRRLKQTISTQLHEKQVKWQKQSERLMVKNPSELIKRRHQERKFLELNLHRAMSQLISDKKQSLYQTTESLDLLSPLKTMGRGYSYVTKNNHIVKSVSDVKIGDEMILNVSDGQIQAEVKEIESDGKA